MKKGFVVSGDTIAIITARGGSKRIPRKNIKEFCGKPIIAYSIETAIHSGVFNEVMVSTDDVEISDIAKKYGASVPFLRSSKTSDDYSTTSDVLIEVIDQYAKMGRHFKYGCCIYPTAPFIKAEKLQEGKRKVQKDSIDAVVPVVAYSYPPQRSFIESDGILQLMYPEYETSRSQDLEKMYHDAGQFYFFKTDSLFLNGSILKGRLASIELSEMEVQDIDTLKDWDLAEMKYRMCFGNE